MHHTLLPAYERKKLRREYRVRALIVLCFTVSVAGLLGIAALVPAFMRASEEQQANESMAAMLKQEKNASGLAAIEKSVTQSQGMIESLTSGMQRPHLSALVEGVASIRGTVRLTSFTVTQDSPTTAVVTIQGVAPTRDELLAFKDRLVPLTMDKKVDLPISELARSTDIQFALRVSEPL